MLFNLIFPPASFPLSSQLAMCLHTAWGHQVLAQRYDLDLAKLDSDEELNENKIKDRMIIF